MNIIPIGTRVEAQGPAPRRAGITVGAPAGEQPAPDGSSWVRWDRIDGDQFDYLAHVEANSDLTELDDQIEVWFQKVDAGLISEIGGEGHPPHATRMLAAVAFTDDDDRGIHFAVRESDDDEAELEGIIGVFNDASGRRGDRYVIRRGPAPTPVTTAVPAWSLGVGLATVRVPQADGRTVGVWGYDSANGVGFCLGPFLGYEFRL